jgi:hypothetical protein
MRAMSAARRISSVLAMATAALAALGARARADHPDGLRTEMSPMATAVLMGGLALAAVLLVLVVAMLLTRKDAHGE